MKELIFGFVSAILFIVFTFFSITLANSNNLKLPFFTSSNGLVYNLVDEYKDYWGRKINLLDLKSIDKPKQFKNPIEIRIQNESEAPETKSVVLVNYSIWDILSLFKYDLALSFIYTIVAISFFLATRDLLIFCFFLNIGLWNYSNVFLLAFQKSIYLNYFSLYIGAFLIYHLNYRLRGKEILSRWVLPQILIASVVGIVANQDIFLLERIETFGYLMVSFFCLVSLLFNLSDLIRFKPEGELKLKKIALIIALLLYLSINISIGFLNGYPIFTISRWLLFILNIFFIILFYYGAYRYTFLTSFVIFTPTLVILLLVVFWSLVYIIIILISYYLFTESHFKERWFMNLMYLFIFSNYLMSSKLKFKKIIDKWFYERNEKLRKGIDEISQLISSPISMRKTILNLYIIVMRTLNVKLVTFILPGDQFPKTDLRNINFIRLPVNSEIWQYFRTQKRVTVTSHFEYGIGLRETLYKFLRDLGAQMAFPILTRQEGEKEVRALIIIGERIDNRFFNIGELKFMNEVTRTASMMLENYSLLENEIQKRRILRDLHSASIVDNTLRTLPPNEISGIDCAYLLQPAVGVSGDMLDIIPLQKEKILILMGDVAGHGLGTGFLVAALKGIIRDSIKIGLELKDIFEEINSFFRARYKGTEFITMLGGILDISEREFTFINAGHLSLIEQPLDGVPILHSKTQRVLGILETKYEYQSLKLKPGSKMFLFSDGITETFNGRGEVYGEESLVEFLAKNQTMSAANLVKALELDINLFREGADLTDDISFVAISLG